MRLLHAGADRLGDRPAGARTRADARARSATRWPATSAAAAPTRRSSAPSLRAAGGGRADAAAREDGTSSGGPRSRSTGSSSTTARELATWAADAELARRRPPAAAAQDGPRARRGARALHGRRHAARHAARRRAALAARARPRRASTSTPRAPCPACARRSAPTTQLGYGRGSRCSTREPEYVGAPIAVVAADTPSSRARRSRRSRSTLEPLPLRRRPRRGPRATSGSPTTRARSVRGDVDAALGGRRRARRARASRRRPTSRPRSSRTRLSPSGRPTSSRVDLDAGHVRGAPGARRGASAYPTSGSASSPSTSAAASAASTAPASRASLAAELSRRHRPSRAPRRTTATSEQLDGGRRAPTRQTIRLGARRDGTLRAIDSDASSAMGVARAGVPSDLRPAMTLYRCAERARDRRSPLAANLRPVNAFRAPGVMEGATGFEQAMDELADALELDPLELRRRNHVDVDQAAACRTRRTRCSPATTRAAELAGWADRDALRDGRAATGCCAASAARRRSGGAAAGRRRTRRSGIGADGVATVVTGIQDIGTGALTGGAGRRRRGARDAARPRPRRRPATRGRTSTARPSGGSQTTPSVTPAVRAAAAEVRAQAARARRRRLRDRARRPRSCATAASARATARSTRPTPR